MIAGRRPPSLERRLIVRLALLYVAAIVVAQWEGEFDAVRAKNVLNRVTDAASAAPGPADL